MTELNESTLHAWFDGELPPEQAAEVEALLRTDPQRAAQARLWQADREALRAQLDATLHEPVPPRLAQTVMQDRAPRWRTGLWAAGVAGIFALGGAAGWLAAGKAGGARGEQAAAGEWLQRAAVAHAVYVPEKRHPVEVSVEQNQDGHLARWLTKRLDVPVKLFDLKAQGFELVGGRLLPDVTGPSAQLMYQDSAGQRVTVYLRKPDEATAAAFRYERRGELGLFYWVDAGCGFALVGPQPRERLLALAEAIYHQGQGASSPAR